MLGGIHTENMCEFSCRLFLKKGFATLWRMDLRWEWGGPRRNQNWHIHPSLTLCMFLGAEMLLIWFRAWSCKTHNIFSYTWSSLGDGMQLKASVPDLNFYNHFSGSLCQFSPLEAIQFSDWSHLHFISQPPSEMKSWPDVPPAHYAASVYQGQQEATARAMVKQTGEENGT